MEDEIGIEIFNLFNELKEIAQENLFTSTRDWLICTPEQASIILENDRRKNETIETLREANEAWRRMHNEQRETIEILRSWITAEVKQVKQRAARLLPPF